jgi:hypothetical protein
MKEFLNCKSCDGTGIVPVDEDFTKPYDMCIDCDGYGAFLINNTKFSVLPMFDKVKYFTKIENNKEVIYHAYYLKGVLQRIITQDEYSKLIQEGK